MTDTKWVTDISVNFKLEGNLIQFYMKEVGVDDPHEICVLIGNPGETMTVPEIADGLRKFADMIERDYRRLMERRAGDN